MATFDEQNSHYLNEKNRLFPKDEKDEFRIADADYNIQFGNRFGATEEETLTKQGWQGNE